MRKICKREVFSVFCDIMRCFQIIHQNGQLTTNKINKLNMFCDEYELSVFIVTEHGFNNTIGCFNLLNYNFKIALIDLG